MMIWTFLVTQARPVIGMKNAPTLQMHVHSPHQNSFTYNTQYTSDNADSSDEGESDETNYKSSHNNNNTNNHPYGDIMRIDEDWTNIEEEEKKKKRREIFRIYFQNINGFKIHSDGAEVQQIFNAMKVSDANVPLSETSRRVLSRPTRMGFIDIRSGRLVVI